MTSPPPKGPTLGLEFQHGNLEGAHSICSTINHQPPSTPPPTPSLAVTILLSVSMNLITLVPHMEKAMATHSSTLAWKIPWIEEPGGLQSMGSLRVRQD